MFLSRPALLRTWYPTAPRSAHLNRSRGVMKPCLPANTLVAWRRRCSSRMAVTCDEGQRNAGNGGGAERACSMSPSRTLSGGRGSSRCWRQQEAEQGEGGGPKEA